MNTALQELTPTQLYPVEAIDPIFGNLLHKRDEFVQQLMQCGLISEQLANSGALEAFGIWPERNMDSLTHVLIGDAQGGPHHLRTIIDLDVPGRIIASDVRPPANASLPESEFRRAQKVRPNGIYRPNTVVIIDEAGQRKESGSPMFPNEWTAEDVIKALIQVSLQPASNHNPERHSFMHEGIFGGVRTRVCTDDQTGKIITGYPKITGRFRLH